MPATVLWIVRNIKWLMLVSGLLTLSMLYTAIAPDSALTSNFGLSLEGPLAQIIVRSWGLLIGLIGAMLVYAAYHAPSRVLVLLVAASSKSSFIALVLVYGRQFLDQPIAVAIAVDALMVSAFVVYLYARPGQGSTAQRAADLG